MNIEATLPWVKESDTTKREIIELTKRAMDLISMLDVAYAALSINVVDISTKKARAPQINNWPLDGRKSFEELGRELDDSIKRINTYLANKDN